MSLSDLGNRSENAGKKDNLIYFKNRLPVPEALAIVRPLLKTTRIKRSSEGCFEGEVDDGNGVVRPVFQGSELSKTF